MTIQTLVLLAAALCPFAGAWAADADAEIEREILAIERKAMDGWRTGDPDTTLAAMDEDVTYFHVMTGGRLDGLAAVRELFERYRGRSLFDSYDIVEPRVQVSGDVAVLTYLYVWRQGAATARWNATQIYARRRGSWRVIHTHFSLTDPAQGN